jgi:RNA polymerase sigma factor (sigma-70 family)
VSNRRRTLTSREKLRYFECKVSPHFQSAYNLAEWLTRSPADAEDVVQEAFLRAFSAFESFRGEDAKPWLLSIVRNAAITFLRRSRNRRSTVGLDDAPEDLGQPAPDPEEILLISCHREQVRRALQRLPLEFREALVLREMEDLSYKEISTTTGVPLGTVMSRLSRGRELLRRILSRSSPAMNCYSRPAALC